MADMQNTPKPDIMDAVRKFRTRFKNVGYVLIVIGVFVSAHFLDCSENFAWVGVLAYWRRDALSRVPIQGMAVGDLVGPDCADAYRTWRLLGLFRADGPHWPDVFRGYRVFGAGCF